MESLTPLFDPPRLRPLRFRLLTRILVFPQLKPQGVRKWQTSNLLLDKEGADASVKLGLNERCTPQSDERLCDVQVLSRLGNEYLLKAGDPKAGDKIFTLPKTAVISRISRAPALDQKK